MKTARIVGEVFGVPQGRMKPVPAMTLEEAHNEYDRLEAESVVIMDQIAILDERIKKGQEYVRTTGKIEYANKLADLTTERDALREKLLPYTMFHDLLLFVESWSEFPFPPVSYVEVYAPGLCDLVISLNREKEDAPS